ncbi:MAG: pyrroloquinoline quinone-dependent dehydrogenase [Alphaproteobacteria bacterium]|nr:pyrroloquinoline quinone-dependent dehydrogenase [Alphaproteobacteria bacterium]
MPRKFVPVLLASVLGGAALAASPTDWPNYGNDDGGARFSPLTQITPANVGKLKVAWTFHLNQAPATLAPPRPGQPRRLPYSTATPIEINGVLYFPSPYGRVIALNAESGKEIWAYDLPKGDQPPFRGVSYWPGDRSHGARIVFGTINGFLIALDAKTGERIPNFGDDGLVDLKTPEIMNGLPQGGYGVTAPGSIYKNLIILGSRLQESPTQGPWGDVRAFDIVTGKLVWTFHTVPRPGEPFHDTWDGSSWEKRSGVNVWNLMTVDKQRGIAYLPVGAPTLDRYGGDHKGDNLFSDSVVAVNAATGKYLWHFQVTHHDIWDWDMDTAPVLLDVKQNGKTIPALAAMNKNALLFILNRVTGKPIYRVDEVKVPVSTEASEFPSPTQPVPSKPQQLARNSISADEIADVTPELKAFCQKLVADRNLRFGARFDPISSDRPMIHFPSSEGGPEWGGGGFDPKLGLFVINTNNRGAVEQLVKNADGTWRFTGGSFNDPATRMMCQPPPWGELWAVNVNTGDVTWHVPLGITDTAPAGKQNTGRVSNGGPIMTASGLTFIAGTDDARFRAFDTKTGKEIWTWKLDYSGHATPITYRGKNGKQYVVLIATGGSYLGSPSGGDSVLAFALP